MLNKQLTKWRFPSETMISEYGVIKYQKWCDRELIRLSEGNKRLHKIKADKNNKDLIAIFRIK